MCGIAGLFNFRGSVGGDRAVEVVRAMIGTLAHRGPDAAGVWTDPGGRCVLGTRRLSVVDTSLTGRQPMTSQDGRWVISFNGEIYNHLELKPALELEGVVFRGHSDTEVLINGLATWRTEILARLDGMFAFAAFDTLSGELLLARDPFGEKPLYYTELSGGGLAFASELQALEQLPGFDGEVSADALAEFLMFEYIGAPRTIYRGVKKLPPGHWLRASAANGLRIGRYFNFTPRESGSDARPVADLADELEAILVQSIRRRLISDVPLGAFLSGGVDSSTVCALIRHKIGAPLKTFSIGFADVPQSEHETASAFAKHLGLEHHFRLLKPDVIEAICGLGAMQDEPNADRSCLPTYLLSQFAREHVTVAISGDGGDEMFGGYERYFEMLDLESMHAQRGAATWRPGDTYYAEGLLDSDERFIAPLFGGVPKGLAAHLGRLRREINESTRPLIFRLRKSDVENYLPGAVLAKVDRMSMRHSLEVRTPYLSAEIARFAETIPLRALYQGSKTKAVLREVAYRHLPRLLVDKPKSGFGLPTEHWAQAEIQRAARNMLGSEDSRLRQVFDPKTIDSLLSGQPQTHRLWPLTILESWCREHPAKFPDLPIVV